MAIIDKYESYDIPELPYIMFFLEAEGFSGYADVVAVIHDERQGLWSLWTTQVSENEIEAVSHCLENEVNDYETDGFSETFDTLRELLASLREAGYEYDFDDMEDAIVDFFSQR